MEITNGKIVAFILAIILVVISLIRLSASSVGITILYLSAPLVMIFFPDEIGGMRGRGINKDTPGTAITAIGWALLLAVGAIVFLKAPK
jgi:hypothetical protein